MSDQPVNTITGRVVSYTTSRGEWKTLLLQREPLDKYEGEHEERLNIPLDVSPFAQKKVFCSVGDWVEVTFRLTGREYQGKHYLSAGVDKAEVCVTAPVEDSPANQPADVEAAQPDAPEDNLPF